MPTRRAISVHNQLVQSTSIGRSGRTFRNSTCRCKRRVGVERFGHPQLFAPGDHSFNDLRNIRRTISLELASNGAKDLYVYGPSELAYAGVASVPTLRREYALDA